MLHVRVLVAVLMAAGALVAAGTGAGAATQPVDTCASRTLILSAYPAEADAVLSHVSLDPDPAVTAGPHHFYRGTIAGKPVLTGMAGIGLVNAASAADAALTQLTCSSVGWKVGAVLFSGVAGGAGRTSIGDVTVPARWTLDDGKTWRTVDGGMLAVAAALGQSASLRLSHVDTAGDPVCAKTDPALVPVVDLGRAPVLVVGGEGYSSDSTGGTSSPCVPGGGDTFGCEPCRAPDRAAIDPAATAAGALAWATTNLAGGSSGTTSASGRVYDAVDEETAAVQVVADNHAVPFLGFRGISDGPGDPLHLPGFPFEFFIYKQIAADNAAAAVAAFLSAWPVLPTAGPVARSVAPSAPLRISSRRAATVEKVASPAAAATAPPRVNRDELASPVAPVPTDAVRASAPKPAPVHGPHLPTAVVMLGLLLWAGTSTGAGFIGLRVGARRQTAPTIRA